MLALEPQLPILETGGILIFNMGNYGDGVDGARTITVIPQWFWWGRMVQYASP
jgi:hypothetical protein